MVNQTRGSLYVGLSGIQLPVPKYLFPPEFQRTSRLTYYASFFNSIEVNTSFYKIPRKQTLLRWADSVPDNFSFTFKLYKEVTHIKNLEFVQHHVGQFMEVVSEIAHKRGCLLMQFPPSLGHEHIDQLEALLVNIEQHNQVNHWRAAVEFRNRSWFNPETYDLLEAYSASPVIHDMKSSAAPMHAVSSDFVYVRLHGPTGNYRGSYTHAFLVEYAEYISDWLSEGKSVYVYFNNTAGDAFNNLRTLQAILG